MSKKSYKYTVTAVNKLTPKIIEVSLKPVNQEKMNFIAGQFVSITFEQAGLPKEFHPFSLASAPDDKQIRLGIKALGDYTTQLVNELEVGATAEVRGPLGSFSYHKGRYKQQIWLAGGIGITPFLSMAEDLAKQGGDYQVDLYYCIRNKEEAVYLSLLRRIEKQTQGQVEIQPFYSAERGHINVDYIKQTSGGLKQKDIFICAPPQMMEELTKEFLVNGVSEKSIYWEKF